MRIDVEGVHVAIDGTPIVDGCDLVAAPGEIVGLIGPNGSGKSTLLRAVYRALRPVTGAVLVGGDDVWAIGARESARRTAVVAQERHGEFDFLVEEVVAMGRAPHKGMLDRDTDRDRAIVRDALERVGMLALAGRVFSTLSGGEKQRVLVARALAQETRVLVLDEPTNHLDIRAQLDLLELVRHLGVTTVAALHDLNLAAAYCRRIYLLDAGRVVAHGEPADVLTPATVRDVFGVDAHPAAHPVTGRLHLTFSPIPTREAIHA